MQTVDYSRQQPLNLRVPSKVIVVGCGGVGSWVAFNLAQIGTKHLVLIDPDHVEATNLNRTPFREQDVGKLKVVALSALIAERRSQCKVVPFGCRAENIPKFALKQVVQVINGEITCVDCRDEVSPLPSAFPKSKLIGGYDGRKFTLHFNPDMESVFSNSQVTYSVTPSYIVVPQILAALIVDYIVSPNAQIPDEEIRNTSMDDLFEHFHGRHIEPTAPSRARACDVPPVVAVDEHGDDDGDDDNDYDEEDE